MEIDLGQEVTYKVKLGPEVYDLREPSVSDVKKLQGVDDNIDAIMELVISLGLPKKVAQELGFKKMMILAEGLMGDLTEKK